MGLVERQWMSPQLLQILLGAVEWEEEVEVEVEGEAG